MTTPVLPTPCFWKDFVRENWEKKPIVLRNSSYARAFTLEDAFMAAKATGNAYLAGQRSIEVGLNLNGVKEVRRLKTCLPQAEDTSLEAYEERLRSAYENQSFTLAISGVHGQHPGLFLRSKQFIAGLVREVGLPASRVDTDVWMGNYKSTPAGIHKDVAGTFMFVLHGHKKMRVWPFDEFQDYAPPSAIREQTLVHGARIDDHMERSILLEGEPGDILYWPSTYWHVGESDGKLHASFTISLHFPWRPLSLLEVMLRQRTEAAIGDATFLDMYPFDADAPQRSAKELPSAIRNALAQLRAVTNSESLERSLSASWLNRVSAYGFTTVPVPAPPVALDDSMRLVACPHSPLVWQEVGGSVLFSANGHAVAVPHHPDVLRLLEGVSSETSFSPASLLASLRNEGDFALEAEHVNQILVQLVSLRALRVEGRES